MESSHMLECAASCASGSSVRGGAEDALFEMPIHSKAAMARPEFVVPDDLCRFDVLVAMSEDARERIIDADSAGAFAHKVVCLTDCVDDCDGFPEEVAEELDCFTAISDRDIERYTDLPSGADQMAVMWRSLIGLERLLMRQFPQDMMGTLHPSLVPRSFTPEMHAQLEALS